MDTFRSLWGYASLRAIPMAEADEVNFRFFGVAYSAVLVLFFLAIGCNKSDTQRPEEELQVKFDSTEMDLGYLDVAKDEMQRTASFQFTNMEPFSIEIDSVRTSCSCISSRFPKTQIKPGESASIDLLLNFQSIRGEYIASAFVKFKSEPPDSKAANFALHCKANVLERVRCLSGEIDFGTVLTTDVSKNVIVRVAKCFGRAEPFISKQSELFTLQLTPSANSDRSDYVDFVLDVGIKVRKPVGEELRDFCEIRASEDSTGALSIPIKAKFGHPDIESYPSLIVINSKSDGNKMYSSEIELRFRKKEPQTPLIEIERDAQGIQILKHNYNCETSVSRIILGFGEMPEQSGVVRLRKALGDDSICIKYIRADGL